MIIRRPSTFTPWPLMDEQVYRVIGVEDIRNTLATAPDPAGKSPDYWELVAEYRLRLVAELAQLGYGLTDWAPKTATDGN